MKSVIDDKLKAVTQAVKDLERASKTAGRVAIRNARRSLWARIQALKEECDVQFTLPLKQSQLPAREQTWEWRAKNLTAAGFDRQIGEPTWWLRSVAGADKSRITTYFDKVAFIIATSCAEYGTPVPELDAKQIAHVNLTGSGKIALREMTYPGFFRFLAKMILWYSRPVGKRLNTAHVNTHANTSNVQLKMIELMKLTGQMKPETL